MWDPIQKKHPLIGREWVYLYCKMTQAIPRCFVEGSTGWGPPAVSWFIHPISPIGYT